MATVILFFSSSAAVINIILNITADTRSLFVNPLWAIFLHGRFISKIRIATIKKSALERFFVAIFIS